MPPVCLSGVARRASVPLKRAVRLLKQEGPYIERAHLPAKAEESECELWQRHSGHAPKPSCREMETCPQPTRVALIGEADVAGTTPGRLLLLASLTRLGVEGTFIDDDDDDELNSSSPLACALLLLFRASHISRARQLRASTQVPLCIPPEDVLALEDKQIFRSWCTAQGFGPWLPTLSTRGVYPAVAKWGTSRGCSGVRLLQNEHDLRRCPDESSCIIEEYIPGAQEFAFHFVAWEGRIVAHATCCYQFSSSLYCKGSVHGDMNCTATPVPLPGGADQLFRAVVRVMKYSGWGNIDFKLDSRGRVRMLELNPRIGLGLLYQESMGADFNRLLAAYVEVGTMQRAQGQRRST